jgi:hypothetical protein
MSNVVTRMSATAIETFGGAFKFWRGLEINK